MCHISSGCEDEVVNILVFLCIRLHMSPQALMTVGRVEKLFMSQRRWERGDVGAHCLDKNERRDFFQKQQFVLQFFLGFLKINPLSRERHLDSLKCLK